MGPVRILTAAAQAHGPEVLGTLYTALGTRYYRQRQPKTRRTIEAALRDAGLAADLADAGDNDSYDEALRASHREGITLVGADVGSPIISIPGSGSDTAKIAFFGPVLNPAPKGEAAARLWDSTVILVSTPGFYEIERTRTIGPLFD